MSEGQILAHVMLFFVGLVFLVFGSVLISDETPKLGLPLVMLGILHIIPGILALWMKVVAG